MPVAAFASLLLAAGSPALGDAAALDALVERIYAPYRGGGQAAYWEAPIYSDQTRQQIQTWARQRGRGTDDVSQGDMLCACQDWDPDAFRVETVTRMFTGPGRAVLLLRVSPTKRDHANVRLSLVKDGSRWAVEDIGDAASGTSLLAALNRAMAGRARR